jgi:hypothetical protein
VETVLPFETLIALRNYEEYISYLSFVGSDLIKLISKSKGVDDRIGRVNMSHIDAEDLIQFLINSIPKVLYNIILPKDVLPPQYRDNDSLEILYRASDLEYFAKYKPFYPTLIKMLVKMLVKLELKPAQQKSMMEVIFRYFYIYHHDKKFNCTDIFIEAYNALSDSVKFAMADEFVLFFRIIRKVGKGKFCDFLLQKSQWLRDIHVKVSEGNFIGYAKETLNPFPTLRISETIPVPHGKI